MRLGTNAIVALLTGTRCARTPGADHRPIGILSERDIVRALALDIAASARGQN